MSLAEKLDQIRAGAAKRISEERRASMGRAVQELRESGILDGVAKVGDRLPAFGLASRTGEMVRSADLLGNRAMVLTVYRGSW